MNPALHPYMEGFVLAGDLVTDVTAFFHLHNDPKTLEHTLEVAKEARRIAESYDAASVHQAVQAALLHDISNVIPVSQMLQTVERLSIEILDEERLYARSVHQKLSKAMARHMFGIEDAVILSAIESHTTYKPHASLVDKILFVSDKISWRLPGEHPHLMEMRVCVNEGELDRAILIYLNSIWEQRVKLKLVHPWLISAREELLRQTDY